MGIATPQSQEKWVEENLERGAKSEPEVVEFTVYDRQDSAPVGTAGLLGILHAHGNAEFAIFLGERRGQGLGTEATRLVLDFAFHVLQLRNVLLETLEWNARRLGGLRARGLSPHRRAPRRADQPRATHRRRAHGRRPAGLRRVGAALSKPRGAEAPPSPSASAGWEDRHAIIPSCCVARSAAARRGAEPRALRYRIRHNR